MEKVIVEETIRYSFQCRPNKPLKFDISDLEKFLGTTMWMSLIKLTRTRRYWKPKFRIPNVAEIISLNKWEEIKRFLHFADNTEMDHEDKVHKIRPILQMLRDALNRIPKEECLCVDEQIVPFKGRSSLKQYNAKKPHKWGYKIWALCGKSGFAYDIELYTGKENNVIQGEVDCGASSNVVVRLSRTIEPVGHTLYFDNYFTSVDLLVFLEKRGIHSVGTVRSNRLTNLSPMSEKELKKSGRGSMNEYTTHVDGVDIYYVQWFDNKVVNLLSTFAGMEPINKVNRWFSSLKQRREIDCPDVVRIYNKHMGGVDLLDSLLGLHRTNVRSKKWYHRIFFHCMDMVVVNSWLLYRRVHVQNQLNVASLSLADFKADLAESLCKFRKGSAKKRPKGRPSLETELDVVAKKARRQDPIPTKDVRTDETGHWPTWTNERLRCRMPACNGQSRVKCEKCQTSLCFSKNSNCFKTFHTE